MTTCTWAGCTQDAAHEQIARGGEVWANLCEAHHSELEGYISTGNVKKLLSSWVKAQGGSESAADRMMRSKPKGRMSK